MNNSADTEARVVLMRPRPAAKSARQRIKAYLEMHEHDHEPYNDRTRRWKAIKTQHQFGKQYTNWFSNAHCFLKDEVIF